MFQYGDRVILVDRSLPGACDNGNLKNGFCGTVVNVGCGHDIDWIGVSWDDHIFGHSCHGFTEDGYGWNVHEDAVELINPANVPTVSDSDLLSLLG